MAAKNRLKTGRTAKRKQKQETRESAREKGRQPVQTNVKSRHLRGGCTGESDGGWVGGSEENSQRDARLPSSATHTHTITRKRKKERGNTSPAEKEWGPRGKRQTAERHAFFGVVGTRSIAKYGRNINITNERTKESSENVSYHFRGQIKIGNKNSTAAQREVVETTLKCYTCTAIFDGAYVRVLLLTARWIFLAVRGLGLPGNRIYTYIYIYICMYVYAQERESK